MLVHRMKVVWSVVELGVYRMCSGANKYIRGSLESVEGELHIVRDCHISTKSNFL